MHHHHWWQVDTAVSDATHTIHRALRAGAWTPQQRQCLRQLGPGTWPQPLPGVLDVSPGNSPGWPGNSPGHPAIEVAIYPDVIRLAAQTLQAPDTSHRAGRCDTDRIARNGGTAL